MRRYTIYNRLCCNYHFADIPFGTPAADEGRRDDDEGG